MFITSQIGYEINFLALHKFGILSNMVDVSLYDWIESLHLTYVISYLFIIYVNFNIIIKVNNNIILIIINI